MFDKDKLWVKAMHVCDRHWGCHQMPERSFFIKGYQFPVCARCTGVMLGYIISFILRIVGTRINFILCTIMILPMAIDGGIQLLTSYKSNNIKRLITGIFAGIGFIQIIFNIIVLFIERVIK